MSTAFVTWHRPEYQARQHELIDQNGCAAHAKVSRSAVSNWSRRHTDFPKLVATFGRGRSAQRLLVKAEFDAWLAEHRSARRTRRSRIEVLAEQVLACERLTARHRDRIKDLKAALVVTATHLRGAEADLAAAKAELDRELAAARALSTSTP